MKFFFSILLFLLMFIKIDAQVPSTQDSSYVKNASCIIDKYLLNKVKQKDYVLYSIANRHFIVFIKNEGYYDEYYIDTLKNNLKFSSHKVKRKEKNIIDKMFNKNTYHDGFVDYFTYNYTMMEGNPVYFYYCDSNNKKYGEFLVTVLVKPTPINKDVYYFILEKIISYINKE